MGEGGLPLSHFAPTTTQLGVKSGCSPLFFYKDVGLLSVAFPPHPDRAGCGSLLIPALLNLAHAYEIYGAATTAMACKNA